PERAADPEQKRAEPRRPAEVLQRKGVDEECRRDAEGHDIGQRIELDAELAGGLHQPRDAAVEQVHDHRDEDRQRRVGEPPFHREQEREEAAEEVAGGEETREQDDAAAALLAQLAPASSPRSLVARDHHAVPSTLTPPVTRSPARTMTRVPRGM